MKGETCKYPYKAEPPCDFNPCTHEGCDAEDTRIRDVVTDISIHAPMKGATRLFPGVHGIVFRESLSRHFELHNVLVHYISLPETNSSISSFLNRRTLGEILIHGSSFLSTSLLTCWSEILRYSATSFVLRSMGLTS